MPRSSRAMGRLRVLPAVLLLGLVVPARTPAADAELRVAVNRTTIESFPLYAAADAISATGAGPLVRLVPLENGRAAMAQLVRGEVDAATGSETQALLNSLAEPRIRIVLTLAECRYRVVVRRSAGIQRISDFRGKTVAVTANTSSHYYMARLLERAGLRESDVRLVSLEGPEMPAALLARSVDVVSIWEPHAENSLEALGADAVVFEDPSAYTERFNLNTTADVLADRAKRSALAAFLQEVVRASTRIRNRPEEILPVVAEVFGLRPSTVRAVWPQFTFPGVISSELPTALVDVEAWSATNQKRQPRSRDELTALIDRSVAAAVPEASGLSGVVAV